MYTKGLVFDEYSISTGTLKSNTYSVIPTERDLIQISSLQSITNNRELCLIEGYCQNAFKINDIHRLILKFYHDKRLNFEEGHLYLDYQQLHNDNIIICPLLANVSMHSWNDKSFLQEQYRKMIVSRLKLFLSIFFCECICIGIFVILLIFNLKLELGIFGFCLLMLANIAICCKLWRTPYGEYLIEVFQQKYNDYNYMLIHFNSNNEQIEEWKVKPCKIDGGKYSMELHKINKICTFDQVTSINHGNGLIQLLFGRNNTRILYNVPTGFDEIIKQRLRDLIFVHLEVTTTYSDYVNE